MDGRSLLIPEKYLELSVDELPAEIASFGYGQQGVVCGGL